MAEITASSETSEISTILTTFIVSECNICVRVFGLDATIQARPDGLAEPDQALSSKARPCFAGPDEVTLKMFYVYILQSQINKDIYVGYTTDLKKRFKQHNSGKVRSTKPYKPWTLVYYESYKGKLDATKREKRLKMHAAKKELLQRLVSSLER